MPAEYMVDFATLFRLADEFYLSIGYAWFDWYVSWMLVDALKTKAKGAPTKQCYISFTSLARDTPYSH
jgi:hypothetical protein